MLFKIAPCTECRKQHRKCVRLEGDNVCKRCAQMDLVCELPMFEPFKDPNEIVDGSKQLKQMRKSVHLLEQTIQQWELELDQYRINHLPPLPPPPPPQTNSAELTTMAIFNRPLERLGRMDSVFSDSSLSTYSTSCSSDTDLHDDLLSAEEQHLLSKGKEWQLTLVNGIWQIDTHINTISDLDALTQRSFLYRPPTSFQNIYADTPIIIQPYDSRTLFPFTAKLTRDYLLSPWKPTLLLHNNQLFPPPFLLVHKPKWVVDRLVNMYFEYYNSSLALLYEPTFLIHYRQLENPLTCPVTMAICSMVCCGHVNHISTAISSHTRNDVIDFDDYDFEEEDDLDIEEDWFFCRMKRRAMGEYFYRHCRETLDLIFDDPERRLETVMTIHLLKRFLTNTLRISEMQKLETIAYLICQDLKSTRQAHENNSVQDELFARNYVFSVWCHVTLDFFMDSISWDSNMDFMAMGILPGESDFTLRFLNVHNRFFKIFTHPSIGNVFRKIQRIMLGDTVELTMDNVLQFDRVTRQWWQGLPAEIRLCDDPYDFDSVMDNICQTQDDVKLTMLLFFLDVVGSFHSCLIKINSRVDNGNSDAVLVDSDVLALIQEKSIKASLDFSEILVVIIKQLDSNVAYTQFLSDAFLFVAVDVLATLTFSDDPVVSLKAKQKLSMCFSALDTADFMDGHRVPLSSSPLNTNLLNCNASLFLLYNGYPQPRYALLYDICRYLSPLDSPLA